MSRQMVRREFIGLQCGDKRLNLRGVQIAERWSAYPGFTFPAMSDTWGWLKGCYRFLSNPKVDRRKLLRPHICRTADRCRSSETVLAVHDTTVLNFTSHPETEGLGPVGHKRETRCRGLLVHTVCAVDGTTREPLGVLDQQVWARPNDRACREASLLESDKWRHGSVQVNAVLSDHSRVLHVGDREADIFLFMKQLRQRGDGFVIRAAQNRLTAAGKVLDQENEAAVHGTAAVPIPRKGRRPARTAMVTLRSLQVTLRPPHAVRGKSLPVNVLYIREDAPPAGQDPLCWVLLTSEQLCSSAECLAVAGYYQARWLIEEFHKGLKTGCRIEDRQLHTRGKLENALGICSVVAVVLLRLRHASRHYTHGSYENLLSKQQMDILRCHFGSSKLPINPSQMLVWIARLGGFIGRRSDGDPGWLTLMRGMKTLSTLEQGWNMAQQLMGKG